MARAMYPGLAPWADESRRFAAQDLEQQDVSSERSVSSATDLEGQLEGEGDHGFFFVEVEDVGGEVDVLEGEPS